MAYDICQMTDQYHVGLRMNSAQITLNSTPSEVEKQFLFSILNIQRGRDSAVNDNLL